MFVFRKSSILLALTLAVLSVAVGCGPPESAPATGAIAHAIEKAIGRGTERFDHSDWDRLLSTGTRGGLVDYRRIKAERAALDAYLDRVAGAPIDRLAGSEVKAFLINAYNALTIRSILEQPDVNSIRDIPGVFSRARHRVGGFDVSLDLIEHNLLRPYFKDPRIHFALNCASRSCAPLSGVAYRGDRLEAQLEEAARRFLTDPDNMRMNGGTLELSAYFQWFGKDFTSAGWTGAGRTIPLYVRRYAPPDVARAIEDRGGQPPVRFLPYDWSLNSAEAPGTTAAAGVRTPGAGGWLPEHARQLRDWTTGPGAVGPLMFAVIYVVLVVLLVPAAPLTIAAGAGFGLAQGFVVASAASTAGAVAAFLTARYVLSGRVREWLARRPAFSRIDAAAGRDSVKVVALARLSPVLPFNLLNYAFGLTRVRPLPYALVSWLAMMPGTLLYVAAGALAVDLASASGGSLRQASVALRVAGVAATAALVWWLARAARGVLDEAPPQDEGGSSHPVVT